MDENKIIKYLSENINSPSKTGELFNHVSLGIGDDAAIINSQDTSVITTAVSYTHLTLPTTPYV